MTYPDLIRLFIEPLETLGVRYFVTGGSTGGHFNLIHARSALRAVVYITAGDTLEVWAFDNRVRISVGGRGIWVAPVVYVIVRKLEYYVASTSDRHLRDVAAMMRVSEDAIDRAELERWLRTRELREALGAAEATEA